MGKLRLRNWDFSYPKLLYDANLTKRNCFGTL